MPRADQYRPAWNRLRRFFAVLGPGLITGAADDDPSAIGTYSVVGAQCGTTVLWTAFITWPLIAAIQMMCARLQEAAWPEPSARNFRDHLWQPFPWDCWSQILSQSGQISPPWRTRGKCSAA